MELVEAEQMESGRVEKEKQEGEARRIVLKSNLFAYF